MLLKPKLQKSPRDSPSRRQKEDGQGLKSERNSSAMVASLQQHLRSNKDEEMGTVRKMIICNVEVA
jgi:hypothetical protein